MVLAKGSLCLGLWLFGRFGNYTAPAWRTSLCLFFETRGLAMMGHVFSSLTLSGSPVVHSYSSFWKHAPLQCSSKNKNTNIYIILYGLWEGECIGTGSLSPPSPSPRPVGPRAGNSRPPRWNFHRHVCPSLREVGMEKFQARQWSQTLLQLALTLRVCLGLPGLKTSYETRAAMKEIFEDRSINRKFTVVG